MNPDANRFAAATRSFEAVWLRLRGLHFQTILSASQAMFAVGGYFVVMRYVVALEGLEGVGIWSLTMGYVAIARLMDFSGVGGLARLISMHGSDSQKKSEVIDTFSIFVSGLYCLLCSLGYILLKPVLMSSVGLDDRLIVGELFGWAMISLPISVLGAAQLSSIDGVNRADFRSIVNIIGTAIFVVAAYFLIDQYGLLGLAYAQVANYVFVLVVARIFLVKKLDSLRLLPSYFSIATAKEFLSYGFRLQVASLPMGIFDPVIRIVLNQAVGLEYLGIYDLAYKLAGHTRAVIQAALTPVVPKFTHLYFHDQVSVKPLFDQINRNSVILTITAYLCLILISPLLSLFLFSSLSPLFLVSVTALSIGCAAATFCLTTQLLARAAGIFRWSITGQWLLVGLGTSFTYLSVFYLGKEWIAVGVALAFAIGHLVAFQGEFRILGLYSKPTLKWHSNLGLISAFFAVAWGFLGMLAIFT
ncbi:MAG: oligosaccharide flippase family protein [Parasphingorhabdus sp.]